MDALNELKQIVSTQKTVSTKRLVPLLKEVDKVRIQQAKRIKQQRKELNSR